MGISNREGMGWTFNTAALRRMGVQDDTPDPPGGPMERDEQGRPLGPMWDNTREVFIRPELCTGCSACAKPWCLCSIPREGAWST